MVSIHSANRNWEQLTTVYTELEDLCRQIEESNKSDSRLFSNYYYVQFMGTLFGEMDGVDFIYKERPGSRLADVIERLKLQYGKHFGEDKIQVLGGRYDESKVDRSKFVYLRIVAVEPYLDDNELLQRQSPFEKRFNLSRFIFETPFTTTGKVHSDDIREQQKRKTILTTELPFPYVIKRLRVVKRDEISLTPIQVSHTSRLPPL